MPDDSDENANVSSDIESVVDAAEAGDASELSDLTKVINAGKYHKIRANTGVNSGTR